MSDYTIKELAEVTQMSKTQLKRRVREGKFMLVDGLIPEEIANQIMMEHEKYIGLCEFAIMHESENFHGSKAYDRKQLQFLLQEKDFYGLHIVLPDELLSGSDKEKVYFLREDIPLLEEKLETFFWGFALSEKEKVDYLIRHDQAHRETCRLLKDFMSVYLFEKNVTPSFTALVHILLRSPDVLMLKDADIARILSLDAPVSTKDNLVMFLNYAKSKNGKIKYSTIARKKEAPVTIPAYSNETYLGLARCFFNAEYIDEHDLIRKALDDHFACEMWLYLTLFYTCGWRAEDVCRGWQYPNWGENTVPKGVDISSLYEDILYDRLPEKLYDAVCDKAIIDINVKNRLPGKTSAHSPRSLSILISPNLKPFYGLLTLIAESHHLRSGEGYMKANRTSAYQNNKRLRRFFGEEINDILFGENIQSRRLNKDFLQGIEEEARQSGKGLLCSAVASYARNHVSLQSIRTYLKDHKLTGESAETVLYFMIERGVFGIEYYQTLLTAYPDVFRELPMNEQNKLITMLTDAVTPLVAEINLSEKAASDHVISAFKRGDEEETLSILEAMFEITQDRGAGKDEGIYCMRRARCEACRKPSYETCIAACCDESIFTRLGYKPLIKVLLDYQKSADKGDVKADAVLKKVLIPRYQKIINQLIKQTQMSKSERIGLRRMLEDALNG